MPKSAQVWSKRQDGREKQSQLAGITLVFLTPYFYVAAVKINRLFHLLRVGLDSYFILLYRIEIPQKMIVQDGLLCSFTNKLFVLFLPGGRRQRTKYFALSLKWVQKCQIWFSACCGAVAWIRDISFQSFPFGLKQNGTSKGELWQIPVSLLLNQ